MITKLRKKTLTENLNFLIKQNINLSGTKTNINKVQYIKALNELTYYDYLDIQAFNYVNDFQKNLIKTSLIQKINENNKNYFNSQSILQFIQYVNSLTKHLDISLDYNNSFFYTSNFIDYIQNIEEYKKQYEIYEYEKMENEKFLIIYGQRFNNNLRH